MEPYQKAAEAIRSGEEYPLKLLQNAGLTALGGGVASVGSKAVSKLIPAVGALINNYVPENLALKGLNKIDPRIGKFMQSALNEGYSFDELRDFMGEKIKKTQETEKKNIIQQYSPELHQFIDEQVKKGNNLIAAGAAAQNKFPDIVKRISKDHKTPWSNILQTVYGQGELQSQQPEQPQQQQQQPQQSGQGQAALMAILQKLQQSRGGQ